MHGGQHKKNNYSRKWIIPGICGSTGASGKGMGFVRKMCGGWNGFMVFGKRSRADKFERKPACVLVYLFIWGKIARKLFIFSLVQSCWKWKIAAYNFKTTFSTRLRFLRAWCKFYFWSSKKPTWLNYLFV